MLDAVKGNCSYLMCDIWASITDVAVHLPHDTNVLVAVEQRVLVVALHSHAATTAMRRLIRLETGIGKDYDQSLRVLVAGWDRELLLGDQLR